MNYRHLYHAGNFADVFKHLVLTLLIQSLQKKPTPLTYLDTHAGIGRYDLTTTIARKTAEFKQGIGRLWGLSNVPPPVATYLDLVRQFNKTSQLRFYPGSPCLAKKLLGKSDRLVLCEWHPAEVQTLQRLFAEDRQVTIQAQDGYQALKSCLPPLSKRGLVLIDPPFEQLTEFKEVIQGLTLAYRRWSTGVYLIWYPIKSPTAIKQFYQQLQQTQIPKMLVAELSVLPPDAPLGLIGAGLIIINPPWQLDQQLQDLLPWLWQQLAINHQGHHRVKWLVTE